MSVKSTAAGGPPAKGSGGAPAKSRGRTTRAAAAKHRSEEPGLVQLLTPQGERVEHDEYALDLTPEEREKMRTDLSAILGYFEQLSAVDTSGVEEMQRPVDLVNVLRDDVPRESLPRERALEQAPDSADGGFRVPTPRAS